MSFRGVIEFRTARVTLMRDLVRSEFRDGVFNEFHLSYVDNPEYREIARWAGYGVKWRRYGVEHELTHHALADWMAWDYSWSLHDNPPQPWPSHVAWEEHIVNRVQRWVTVTALDEFEVLDSVFGERLDEFCESLCRKFHQVPIQMYL